MAAVMIYVLMFISSLVVAAAMAATLAWFFRRLRAVERYDGRGAP